MECTTGLKPRNIRRDICYVRYNETLANYVPLDRESNETSERAETELMKAIYSSSCSFDEQSENLVALMLVEETDQCQFGTLSSRVARQEKGTGHIGSIGAYIAIILTTGGIAGNTISLSILLSTEYQKRHSVYSVAKGLSEIMLLLCTILQLSLFFSGNANAVITDYLHPVFYQFALFSRSWITVVIGIEKCIAVWAPFYARAHLGRGMEIKMAFIIVAISISFTVGDFLTKYFMSELNSVIDIDNLFIGNEVKIAIYSVAISFFLPWIIVDICSVLGVLGVRSIRKKRYRLTRQTSKTGNDKAKDDNNDLVLPVLLNLLSFLVCCFPCIMYATFLVASATLENTFLTYEIIGITGIVSIFFNIIGFSMDFYLSLARQPEFRQLLKTKLTSVQNIIFRRDENVVIELADQTDVMLSDIVQTELDT